MPRLARNRGLAEGYKSGLELTVAHQIEAAVGSVAYEDPASQIAYHVPDRMAKYKPDFVLPNGLIIETKGRLVTADRKKHLLIQEQHPQKDIRFVFTNPNARISKTSETTYAMWCDKHGFKHAKALIPTAWFTEKRKAA